MAFPAVSAGVYGWDVQQVAGVAVEVVRAAQTDALPVDDVRFVLFSDTATTAFQRALACSG